MTNSQEESQASLGIPERHVAMAKKFLELPHVDVGERHMLRGPAPPCTVQDMVIILLSFLAILLGTALTYCIIVEDQALFHSYRPKNYDKSQIAGSQEKKKDRKLNIALLSAVDNIGTHLITDYFVAHEVNQLCACQALGCSPIFDITNYLVNYSEEKKAGNWIKVAALMKWLPHYDWVLMTDVDVSILGFDNRSLESFIEQVCNPNRSLPLILSLPNNFDCAKRLGRVSR